MKVMCQVLMEINNQDGVHGIMKIIHTKVRLMEMDSMCQVFTLNLMYSMVAMASLLKLMGQKF